jgi:hypothetical protein
LGGKPADPTSPSENVAWFFPEHGYCPICILLPHEIVIDNFCAKFWGG